jgi:hypothetical protein
MPRECHPFASVFRKIRALRSGASYTLMAGGRVTVLLLLLGSHKTLYAEERNETSLRVFEFRCEFQMPITPGRYDGLMASDGDRQRIAIYWMEPAMFREAPSFLRCADLIFDRDVAHYWIHGISQPGAFHLSDGEKGPLLPAQKSAESVLRSALAIVGRIRSRRSETATPLEVATFFERGRGQADYEYVVSPNEAHGSQSFDSADSGTQILNALPYGREYSKETRDDGAIVWRAQKGANGPRVATVTIQRLHEFAPTTARGAFDVKTLGQWTLISEVYRDYWSSARALEAMRSSSDVCTSARDLYGKLDSYLDRNKAPAEVSRALERLRFHAALMTSDSNCVWQSAQAVVAGLCADETVPEAQCLVDLGSMSGRIQKQHPERMEEQLRLLVAQVVRHAGQEASASVDRLMGDILNNGWFTYGELLLTQMGRTGLIPQRDVNTWTAKLQASRLARGDTTSDPCDATPSVQRYLAQLDADPPKGTLDMNDIHRILNEGLAKRYTQDQSDAKREVVEKAIRSIRLIGGEGPFCGDPARLVASTDRFSRHCLEVNKSPASFDAVLATFLALSFCDTSTPEDHERLFGQLQSRSRALQSQINAMLAARGLAALVTAEDVERTFQAYERRFQQYMDDPLWAPFKFPWTRDEEDRLDGALRLRLAQLEPVFDEMSLKVKYGGPSDDLKGSTLRAISMAAQQLLSRAAFLRMPLYPGVGCRYLGGYGFAVVIRSPLYQEGHRPREMFQAMKYFHLGHRLQDVVEREREMILPAEKEEMQK